MRLRSRVASVVLKVSTLALCVLALSSVSRAGDEFLYANNAGLTGTDHVWQIDVTLGDKVTNDYAIASIGNGRGVIDVNNILYVTTASSGNVYSFNIATNALSTVFTVSGSSALASITYDGTNFWIGDYSGSNKAFLYTPGGTLLKTITLSDCTFNCDGLTFVAKNGGELLSNRFDGAAGLSQYDLYDTSGNLIKADFIDTTGLGAQGCTNSTGIAWDGTNFFVSCIFGKIAEFDANGNLIGVTTMNTNGFTGGPLIEGMSANFAITIPPPPPPSTTPEPATLSLLGLGAVGLGFLRRRKRV